MSVALVFLAVFALYLRTLCPAISSGDGSELFLAAARLDVTHPPGYPLQALLHRLALELPVGGLVFRAGLTSAAAGALACLLTAVAVRRLGGGRSAAALAAAALAVIPYAWWQSTMLEKYALHLALASGLAATALRPSPRCAAVFLAAGLALLHNPLAVLLIPLLLPAALARWREPRAGRALAIAATCALLPLTLRPVYAAIRAHALDASERGRASAVNWGEPFHARALADYLTLKFYRNRFSREGGLAAVPLREQLAFYPAQLTWPGLLLGAGGLVWLLRRNPGNGAAVGAVLPLSLGFSAAMSLPRSLAPQTHQNAYLVLVIGAGIALGAISRSRLRVRWLPAAAAAGAAGGLALLAGSRFPSLDAGRHLQLHDYTVAQLKSAPPRAVFLGAFDYDLFSVACLQRCMGLRPDVTPLPFPRRTADGEFVVRRRYEPLLAAALPEANLRVARDETGFSLLRRMIERIGRARCVVISGLSEPVVPRELFTGAGPIFIARGGACAPADTGPARAWRALSTRSWFHESARRPVHRVVLDYTAQGLLHSALRLTDERQADLRGRLLKRRSRLIPDTASAWLALGEHRLAHGETAGGLENLRRAVEIEPSAPEARLSLLRAYLARGRAAEARALLHDSLSRPPFAETSAAEPARRALASGRAGEAFGLVPRVFAEVARDEARRLPANPEYATRRIFLSRLAADLAPDWSLAQSSAVRVLCAGGRIEEARTYLARLSPDRDPDDFLAFAVAALAQGRPRLGRDRLREVVSRRPASGPAWFYLAQAELALGRSESAARAFSRFLELEPRHDRAPEVRRLLRGLAGTPADSGQWAPDDP